MIGNALFALGIVLTTASQLRLPGVPLGIGEICLVFWLALAVLRLLGSGRISSPRATLLIASCPHARTVRVTVTPSGRSRESCRFALR